MKKKKRSNSGQYIGLAFNFGVILVVSMFIMFKVGAWIDAKLGTKGIFTLIFVIMGIASGFRVLMNDVASIDRKNKYKYEDDLEEEYDWKIPQVEKLQEKNKNHKLQ